MPTRAQRREGDSLLGAGAAGDQPKAGPPAAPLPSWWSPPKRFCVRGHDTYFSGAYLHMNGLREGKKKPRVRRCRQCRIDDVRKCLGRTSGVQAGW